MCGNRRFGLVWFGLVWFGLGYASVLFVLGKGLALPRQLDCKDNQYPRSVSDFQVQRLFCSFHFVKFLHLKGQWPYLINAVIK